MKIKFVCIGFIEKKSEKKRNHNTRNASTNHCND